MLVLSSRNSIKLFADSIHSHDSLPGAVFSFFAERIEAEANGIIFNGKQKEMRAKKCASTIHKQWPNTIVCEKHDIIMKILNLI